MWLKSFFKKAKRYDAIAGISEIGRRAFAQNSFDGVLTTIGIIMGTYFGKVDSPRIVITTVLGASIAMGVSGMWGTYFAEKAERAKKTHELEMQVLRKLKNTLIGKAERFATVIISLVDGLSPFIASVLVLIPFFFIGAGTMGTAYIISLALAFAELALLGAFLGKVSEESLFKSSLKMMVAGFVCIILSLLLEHI